MKAVDSFLRIKAFVEIVVFTISKRTVGVLLEFGFVNFNRLPQAAANASAFTMSFLRVVISFLSKNFSITGTFSMVCFWAALEAYALSQGFLVAWVWRSV